MGLGSPGALRAAVGCGLYLALLAVLSAGTAALLRSPVASLGLLIPLLCFVAPILGSDSAIQPVTRFLPDAAGQQILHTVRDDGLAPWTGLAVLALWAAAVACAGWRVMERRDA
ncbi:hypothetical protein [Streptomyces sp. H27-D2]|uniref:hypothetical protein n=1 Tax=Streptomyces sp. H27-D2 TaxID=3046304 RepID=UPI002DBB9562|nr:hypothetical protein [Streptomyces sp. H27-D2]MEC4021091.1 hypothetical protein [Streptomyces sp. H27-D2]